MRFVGIAALIIVGALFVLHQLPSPETGQAPTPTPPADTVMIVNGEAITRAMRDLHVSWFLHDVEGMTETLACELSTQNLIESVVAQQAAVAEGLTVSEQEIDVYVEEQQSLAAEYSEYSELIERERVRLGQTESEYWEGLRGGVREALLVMKLNDVLRSGGESATQSELEATATAMEEPRSIVIIPIHAGTPAELEALYAELNQAAISMTEPGQFDDFVMQRAREEGSVPQNLATGEPFESYGYRDPANLPDYAAAAAELDEGDIGLLVRSDGTGTVYHVLGKTDVDDAVIMAWLREEDMRESEGMALETAFQALVDSADVQILEPCKRAAEM